VATFDIRFDDGTIAVETSFLMSERRILFDGREVGTSSVLATLLLPWTVHSFQRVRDGVSHDYELRLIPSWIEHGYVLKRDGAVVASSPAKLWGTLLGVTLCSSFFLYLLAWSAVWLLSGAAGAAAMKKAYDPALASFAVAFLLSPILRVVLWRRWCRSEPRGQVALPAQVADGNERP